MDRHRSARRHGHSRHVAARSASIIAGRVVVAAVCTYAATFRFYARFLATRILEPDGCRATPAERLANGVDSVPTHR